MGTASISDPYGLRIPRLRYGRLRALLAGLLIAVDLPLPTVWPRSGVPVASAHDNWIARGPYRSPRDGKHCCGENDCFPVDVEDIVITPHGYRLRSGEQVPFEEALLSEDGTYWRC